MKKGTSDIIIKNDACAAYGPILCSAAEYAHFSPNLYIILSFSINLFIRVLQSPQISGINFKRYPIYNT